MTSSFKQTGRTLQRFGSKIVGAHSQEKVKMPGKSNKFDFTNRPNSGAKLGEIIGANLQKEAEKAQKDAARHAAKARKQSSDGTDGSYEVPSNTHIIDLKAPGKDLGDDGVCAMADGMEIALRSGSPIASLALEDLNLANNKITTVSLARLAPVIRLAKYDLKTINLSDNRIEVDDDEQAQQWEVFLLAFSSCMKMRRLDLSGNERLGSRALEILARIHVNEEAVTPVPPGGNTSVLSLVSESSEDADGAPEKADSVADFDHQGGMIGGTFLDRRCGLRSIPYITLHQVGLEDAGALWLSYAVEDHFYPSQLISELNATNGESIIKAYQQNTHSRGLDWSENQQLGKEGAQLLARAEAIREHRLHSGAVDTNDLLEEDDEGPQGRSMRRNSSEKLAPRSKAGHRRVSIRSIRTTDGGEHETCELESARKKIMRHIIGHDGAASVELWRASLEAFWTSRLVLLLAPLTRKHHTGSPLFVTSVPASPTCQPPSPTTATAKGAPSGLRVDTEAAKNANSSMRASYASKLQETRNGSGEQDFVITEVTNTPTTPLRLQKPTHRKGAFSEGTELDQVSGKLNALIVRDDSPLRFVKFQQGRIEAKAVEGKTFRDRSSPTHLPGDVLQRVVGFVVGARGIAACGLEGARRAIQRGQDRSTLMAEREWLKKDQSAQVLMLLDSIQCLHYCQ